MLQKRNYTFLGIFLLSLFYSCGGPSRISVQVQKPASVSMPGVKKIAVVDFIGQNRSGSQIATLTQSMLLKTEHFSILERDKLKRILEEQNMAMSGIVDDATAVEAGKLLGVDALIFGEVTTYEVEPDQKRIKKEKEKKKTGKYRWVEKKDKKTGKIKKVKEEIIEEVWVEREYWVRQGTVAVNFRVVDVQSGQLLAAHSDSKSYDSGTEKRSIWKKVDDPKSLKPVGEILSDLSKDICRTFVQTIAPHTVSESRDIETGEGDIKVGKTYAEAGLWPEAQEAWERAVKVNPKDPIAMYNLGLAYEVQGMLVRAEAAYKQAIQLKQKKRYMEALARVRQAQEDQALLEEQLND